MNKLYCGQVFQLSSIRNAHPGPLLIVFVADSALCGKPPIPHNRGVPSNYFLVLGMKFWLLFTFVELMSACLFPIEPNKQPNVSCIGECTPKTKPPGKPKHEVTEPIPAALPPEKAFQFTFKCDQWKERGISEGL